MRWPLQPLQPLQKAQLQTPFGSSVDSLCHPCITTTHLSYSALSLKLPRPPCAVLLVIRLYTPYVFTSSHLASSDLVHRPLTQQSLQKACPSTVLLRTAKLAQGQEGARGQTAPLRTTKFGQSTSQYYFVVQSLQQTTSQYYFVLQSLHKVRPSTSLYYQACTKYFPVKKCTTKFAQSTSQCYVLRTTKFAQNTSKYYFVLQICTKYFPVLHRTSKFAGSTSQYYVLRTTSLHKIRPSTTSYYKACTKNFPVPLCTTRFAQSTSQLYFVLQNLHKVLPYAGLVQAVTVFIGLIPVMSSVNDYSLD